MKGLRDGKWESAKEAAGALVGLSASTSFRRRIKGGPKKNSVRSNSNGNTSTLDKVRRKYIS